MPPPTSGVLAELECCEGKLAGWKRGSDGSLRDDEPVLVCLTCGGGWRRACEGIARDSILGERGDEAGGGGICKLRAASLEGIDDAERWARGSLYS